eukprot:284815568_2
MVSLILSPSMKAMPSPMPCAWILLDGTQNILKSFICEGTHSQHRLRKRSFAIRRSCAISLLNMTKRRKRKKRTRLTKFMSYLTATTSPAG